MQTAFPWLALILLLLGFGLIVWSADRFVDGAAELAEKLGVSPLVIGLTVVGIGSSAPEILVSVVASWQGTGAVAVGNAVGSNIANVALVLGVAAVIRGVTVRSALLRREYPVTLGCMLLAGYLMSDGTISRGEGLAMLLLMAVLLTGLVQMARRTGAGDPLLRETTAALPPVAPGMQPWLLTVGGLIGLLIASRLVVEGAVDIARWADVSELVIGLTIVAIGTSLPEVAASVASVLKGQDDLAVGNVLGSNIANMLVVLGGAALVNPLPAGASVLWRDLPAMLLASIVLGLFALLPGAGGRLGKPAGIVLLASYAGYLALLALGV